jgi:hypothetical protein
MHHPLQRCCGKERGWPLPGPGVVAAPRKIGTKRPVLHAKQDPASWPRAIRELVAAREAEAAQAAEAAMRRDAESSEATLETQLEALGSRASRLQDAAKVAEAAR